VPGPICYSKGGRRVTITDANVLLNRIPADHFLGGKMALDVGSARAAVETDFAKPLGISSEEVCGAIIEIANANMLKMLRIVSVEQGYDPQDFCLIPSGGSGPVHAVELAEELGIREVIVPPAPGLLSSQGLLSADIRYDFRRTFVAAADKVPLADLAAVAAELRAEGEGALAAYSCRRTGSTSACPRTCAIWAGLRDQRAHGRVCRRGRPSGRDRGLPPGP
jgi:N-methylhydantoinase A